MKEQLEHVIIFKASLQKYYENESKFNGVYSRNNLSKIKDEALKINLDENE